MKYECYMALMILDVLHEADQPMPFDIIAERVGVPEMFIADAFARLEKLSFVRSIHCKYVGECFTITTIGDIHYLITMEAA